MANELSNHFSIARAMMFVALVAINCALMREVPWEILRESRDPWSLPDPRRALGVVEIEVESRDSSLITTWSKGTSHTNPKRERGMPQVSCGATAAPSLTLRVSM
jgi:hypothetical protein